MPFKNMNVEILFEDNILRTGNKWLHTVKLSYSIMTFFYLLTYSIIIPELRDRKKDIFLDYSHCLRQRIICLTSVL